MSGYFNRYVEVPCLNRFRKGGTAEGEDQSIHQNKFIVPAKTNSPHCHDTLSRQFLTYLVTNSFSKSCDRITPLDEFRKECAVTMIGRMQRVFDLSRHFEWLSFNKKTFLACRLSQRSLSKLQKVINFARLPHCLMQWWETLATILQFLHLPAVSPLFM